MGGLLLTPVDDDNTAKKEGQGWYFSPEVSRNRQGHGQGQQQNRERGRGTRNEALHPLPLTLRFYDGRWLQADASARLHTEGDDAGCGRGLAHQAEVAALLIVLFFSRFMLGRRPLSLYLRRLFLMTSSPVLVTTA